MTDIFISYAREDEPFAKPLAEALERAGWSVFWDRTIPPGKAWREHIGLALDTARCVIVVWSSHSASSQWVMEEADRAVARGVLVPVRSEDVAPPLGFGGIQAADLAGWAGDAADERLIALLDPRRTVARFKRGIAQHGQWQRAITDCGPGGSR